MCSLDSFNSPPEEGNITICEWENQLITSSPNDPSIRQFLDKSYPSIEIPCDTLKPLITSQAARTAFIQHHASVWQRAVSAWKEHGFIGTMEEFASNRNTDDSLSSNWLSMIACHFLSVLRWVNSLPGSLFPHLLMSSDDLIAEFSSTANWKKATIRTFAWHPCMSKFAIALHDDSVWVHSTDNNVVPTLKLKQQKGISEMAWQPFSDSVLAVACEQCIVIWHVDPTSLITRPSANCVQILAHSAHYPVTSIAWNPNGTLLVSASAASTAMLVWDVAMEECVPLRRIGGGGVSLVRWSPDSSLVFAATPSTVFRVWETQKWSCEWWRNLSSRCQAACWSPDASVLLFATKDEPIIYGLTFTPAMADSSNSIGGSKAAVPIVNLGEVIINSAHGAKTIGGLVQNMDWDSSGERFAVSFMSNDWDESQNLIAVFRTRLKPMLEITPCGFVRGRTDEIPQFLCFQKSWDNGALLAVCWKDRRTSSSRVGFIPFYFVASPSISAKVNKMLNAFTGAGHDRTHLFSSE